MFSVLLEWILLSGQNLLLLVVAFCYGSHLSPETASTILPTIPLPGFSYDKDYSSSLLSLLKHYYHKSQWHILIQIWPASLGRHCVLHSPTQEHLEVVMASMGWRARGPFLETARGLVMDFRVCWTRMIDGHSRTGLSNVNRSGRWPIC